MAALEYQVQDENGIHARPAGVIVSAAKKFRAEIWISVCGTDRTADAKKLFSVMGLGVQKGERLLITANGTDADEAIACLEAEMRRAGL